jgi:hypothetical protein
MINASLERSRQRARGHDGDPSGPVWSPFGDENQLAYFHPERKLPTNHSSDLFLNQVNPVNPLPREI